MDIEKVLQDEFKKIVESGFIEEKISENLKKTMSSVIADTLNGYHSDFKTAIEEKLKNSFNTDLDKLSIPEYQTKILSIVQNEIDLSLKNEVESSLKQRVKEFFQPIEDREYSVSEIVEMYKDSIRSEFMNDCDYIDEDHEITAFTEQGSHSIGDKYYELYLDKEPNKKRYSCEYHIRINETGIWHISVDSVELIKTKHSILDKFERFLFQAYSQKVLIRNNSDNIENWISSDRD